MALFPRMSSFGPLRSEFGPFVSLFNDTFNELQRISDTFPTTSGFAPKFDVKETKEEYQLEGELPGINQKDLTIEFSDEQTLTVKGRSDHTREEGAKPSQHVTHTPKDGEQEKTSESKEVATTGGVSSEVAKHRPQHTYWVSERSVGEFARSFAFPHRVDQANVKASLKNGILSIVVPKLPKANTSRRVTIEVE